MRSLIRARSPNFFKVFFFLTYSESFLTLYLLPRRRAKIPEPCTLLVNFLIKPRLLSLSFLVISTLIAMLNILSHPLILRKMTPPHPSSDFFPLALQRKGGHPEGYPGWGVKPVLLLLWRDL